MKIYLSLVDAGATTKIYQKKLGLKGNEVKLHIRFVNYYRAYIKMSEEIAELAKKKRGSTMLERARIRAEIGQIRTRYAGLLSKLKAGK